MGLRSLLNRMFWKREEPPEEKVYLGAFGMTVEQAVSQGWVLVASAIGNMDREWPEMLAWCEAKGCRVFWDRVFWNHWKQCWESCGISGMDVMFIMAPDEYTAMEARLTWG